MLLWRGPLAGLVIAIPALLMGLHSSVILTASPPPSVEHMVGVFVGSSVLLALLSKIALGSAFVEGPVLRLSTLAAIL